MSMRYPGGLIASSPVNAAYPSGVWTQAQTQPYAAQNVWMRDQFWPNTTLLLQGNGTNGAQNNTFLDSSTNNFTITRNGNTTQGSFTPYEANGYWSNYFGGSQSINAASSSSFQLTGDFTIECWVFRTATGDASVYLQNSGSNYFALNVNAGTGFNIYLNSGSPTISPTDIVPATNVWNHVALVRSGSTVKVYLNGVASATTATNSSTLGYNAIAYVGGFGTQSGGSTVGYISNARVVTSAVYTSNFAPPAAPLTAISGTVLLTCQSNRFIDNSTNAFAITVNGDTSVQAFQPFPGATTWSGSVLGGSGYFDGSGDYLSIANNAALQFGTGDFTVECWVYLTAFATDVAGVVAKRSGAAQDGTWAIDFAANTGDVRYRILNSTGGVITVSIGTVGIGVWTHIAVSKQSGTTRTYINGVAGGTTTNATSIDGSTNALTIGVGDIGTGKYLNGYISNLRVVKGTAVYTAAFTPPTVPLTAITNTQLLTNFTNAGIFDSAMMNDLETVGNAQVSTSVVKYGTGSMAFDGSGDYLLAPDNPALNLSADFTVEAWVNVNNISSEYCVFHNHTSNSNGIALTINSGAPRGLAGNGSWFILLNSSITISAGTWNHVAFTRSGSTFTIWVNGQSGGTASSSTTPTYSGGAQIGRLTSGVPLEFPGYIDDLRVTRGVARYVSSFTPPVARMPQQ